MVHRNLYVHKHWCTGVWLEQTPELILYIGCSQQCENLNWWVLPSTSVYRAMHAPSVTTFDSHLQDLCFINCSCKSDNLVIHLLFNQISVTGVCARIHLHICPLARLLMNTSFAWDKIYGWITAKQLWHLISILSGERQQQEKVWRNTLCFS